MALQEKQNIIHEYAINGTDTGSIEVQVALLTNRINEINGHLGRFPKDMAGRFGLMKLVGRRRSFLDYLKKNKAEAYYMLLDRLGIRK